VKTDREVARSGELNRALEEAAAIRAEGRLKSEEARRINGLFLKLATIHQAEFPPTSRPVPPPTQPIDEAGIRKRHVSAAKAASSALRRSERSAALDEARNAAAREIEELRDQHVRELERWQEQADAWWSAMLANEATTVLNALAGAFEDNEAAAAAVGVDEDEVTLLVVVPHTSLIPTERPISVSAEAQYAAMAPIAEVDRAALYMSLVTSYALVTVKEAFAVAPAIQAARIIAVRRKVGFANSAEIVLASRLERTALEHVDWNEDEGALKILHDAASDIVVNPGPKQELMPIRLSDEPDLAAVLQIVDFTDVRPQVVGATALEDSRPHDSVGPVADDGNVTEFEALHAAAQRAKLILDRGAGIAGQITAGEWDTDLSAEQARDLADSLAEAAEVVRTMRSNAGEVQTHAEPRAHWPGLLPLNRKERFFTGTVFPGLVAGTGFWHIQRLLDLFGVPVSAQGGEFAQIQFLTEYGFAESVYTDDDRAKWGDAATRETPDIVIAGPDWLLAIEAKMYHAPSAAALNEQMAAQAPIVRRWRDVLGLPAENVVHALLLPARLAQRERAGLVNQRVVTWEALLNAFRGVGPRYWVSVLAEALDRHADLESRSIHQQNAESILTGAEIVEDAKSEAPSVGFVGRVGGVAGARFTADVESGQWRTQKYRVRSTAVPATNRNWMPVAAFLAAVATESID
jgi:hypothetical protein